MSHIHIKSFKFLCDINNNLRFIENALTNIFTPNNALR